MTVPLSRKPLLRSSWQKFNAMHDANAIVTRKAASAVTSGYESSSLCKSSASDYVGFWLLGTITARLLTLPFTDELWRTKFLVILKQLPSTLPTARIKLSISCGESNEFVGQSHIGNNAARAIKMIWIQFILYFLINSSIERNHPHHSPAPHSRRKSGDKFRGRAHCWMLLWVRFY